MYVYPSALKRRPPRPKLHAFPSRPKLLEISELSTQIRPHTHHRNNQNHVAETALIFSSTKTHISKPTVDRYNSIRKGTEQMHQWLKLLDIFSLITHFTPVFNIQTKTHFPNSNQPTSSSQTLAPSIASPSSKRRNRGGDGDGDGGAQLCLHAHSLNRSALFGAPSTNLSRSRSCGFQKSRFWSIRRTCRANLDAFSDEEFSKKIQELALRFQLADNFDGEDDLNVDGNDSDSEPEAANSDDNHGVSESATGMRFEQNQSRFQLPHDLEPPWPSDWQRRDEIVPEASIELKAVGSNCPLLEELRVFPSDPDGDGIIRGVTEFGFVTVSYGCRKIRYILYFCWQMTNAAVVTVAQNCPDITHFRLCIMIPGQPDYMRNEPMDEAFGAVAKNYTKLQRLSVSGLLTDRAFEYIGKDAKNLEKLSVAFAGKSDLGMQCVLKGCPKLKKLEIRDCPFGNAAFLSDIEKYESMRSLWMSACNATINACRLLASQMPRLNVEIMKDEGDDDCVADKVYVYRSVAGPRRDAPPFVLTF